MQLVKISMVLFVSQMMETHFLAQAPTPDSVLDAQHEAAWTPIGG
jgi:hypothetical protein